MKIPSFIASNLLRLGAKFSFLLVIPILLGSASVATRSGIAAPFSFHKPASGLQLLSVVSRKIHGPAGPFDIDLPLAVNLGIETRFGGVNLNHTLVFTFNHNMDPNANPSTTATVTPAGAGNVAPRWFSMEPR